MGSSYYGDGNLGNNNERGLSSSASSSSSSRKGKKGNSDKPKQPQRGLGVAQLEKIRLHGQLASNYLNPYSANFSQEDMRMQTPYSSSSSSFSYSSSSSSPYGFQGPHGVMMGLPDMDKTNIRYGDHNQSSSIARWHNAEMGTQHSVDPSMTRPFFEPGIEGSMNKKKKKNKNENQMGSSGDQNSESSSSQDIDLELRL
ncbi:hypothetical protein CDL12_15092 [Handroanthus impetiginosus]|uniref:Uncharacterized protein n=1 Tax=Handroanthus impetiginosus TaxID=429701 RepID=A0A2G9H448_9LAMI|nr:hypothetical protein CDL12_15092 [Handroanthus impetiginosus]